MRTLLFAVIMTAATCTIHAQNHLVWTDARQLTIEGAPFEDSTTSYSRMAQRHKPVVSSGVWSTGQNAAGVAIRFETDSADIHVKWDAPNPVMNHMAASGSNGVDLYEQRNGEWIFKAVGRPKSVQSTTELNTASLVSGETTATRKFLLFLPLYSKVNEVEIGTNPGAKITGDDDSHEDKLPVVFYGTSITQGGCASRAGMSHPAILRRWLDHPVINLGFSGSGKCEPPMVEIVGHNPAALFVIETVPNMNVELIESNAVPFMQNLRKLHPETPILMVESPLSRRVETNAAWKKAYDQLIESGLSNLHYLDTTDQFTTVEEPTVDGVHPTDMGFYTMAVKYEPIIREILDMPAAAPKPALQR